MKNLYNYLILFCLLSLPNFILAQVTVSSSGLLTVPRAGEAIRLSGSNSYLTFYNGGTYNGYLWHNNTNMYLTNRHATGNLYFGTNNGTKMTIEPGGQVGIGTTSPDVKLHVKNDAGGNMFRMESTTGNGYLSFNAGASLEGWVQNYNDNMDITSNTGQLWLRTLGAGEDVRVITSGKFSVETDEIRLDDASGKYLNFYNGATRIGYVSALANNNLQFEATNGGGLFLNSDANVNINTPGGSTYFSSAGNVGFGTASPDKKLTVIGQGRIKNTGQGANFIYERTDKSAFAMGAGGQAGLIFDENYNFELRSGVRANVVDGQLTNGALRFKVRGTNGYVGIGTSSPSTLLHVNGDITYCGSLINCSDRRLKQNITEFPLGLEEVKQLNPVTYQYNGEAGTSSEETHVGMIAQELKKVSPELVTEIEYEEEENGRTLSTASYLAIKESSIKYLLINSVKELAAENDGLKNDNLELKEENQKIKESMAQLEERMQHIEKLLSSKQDLSIDEKQKHEKDVTLNGQSTVAELAQNRPNPFEEHTSISYYLPEGTSGARMIIFSSAGKVLKTITINETGNGQINIQANSLPAGSYMYQLVTDNGVVGSKSMMLIK